ncbi:unnamed protein product [Rotaria sordida]|uniref:Uncharacterized protein n=1 Tax=Rotaria sordida TaxID=392033 RepID=A0A816FLY6_9BILA|nr:unnamed protein product [Rotaria sordida]CAF1663418.1 unnamed protein product [Rotaria sordida]
MNSIDFNLAHLYGQQKRKERYNKHNAARRRIRLTQKKSCFPHISTTIQHKPSIFEQNIMEIIENEDFSLYDDHECINGNSNCLIKYTSKELNVDNDDAISIMLNYGYNETVTIEEEQSDDDNSILPDKLSLYNYTIDSTYDYCEAFIIIARQANLSKNSIDDKLFLIKSDVPVPNNLRPTEEKLLLLLGVTELFTKRSICLLGDNEFNYQQKICSQCCSTDKNSIAYVYESNVELIIKKIMIRLLSNINEF